MQIYKKYFLKSFIYPFLLISFVITSMVWIAHVMRLLSLIEKGVSFFQFFSIVFLVAPSLLFIIMPLVTVITILLIYFRFKEEHQLIIFQISGLSEYDILKPGLIFATITTLLTLVISVYLMPLSYNFLKDRMHYLKNNYVSNIIEIKKFNQISKDITIYVDGKDEYGNLEGIFFFDAKAQGDRSILFAKKGSFKLIEGFVFFELNKGFRQSYDNNKNMNKMYFDNILVTLDSNQNFEKDRVKNSEELFINEMLFPDDKLDHNIKKRLKIDGHMRIIWPFLNFAFTFLLLSIFLKSAYSRKQTWKPVIISIMPVIVVSFIHFTVQKLAFIRIEFIVIGYINLLSSILFSYWYSTRRGCNL